MIKFFSAIIISALAISAYFYFKDPDLNPAKEGKFATYVINLDRELERLNYMQNLLGDYDIAFDRVRAVDGYEIEITDLATGEKFKGADLKQGAKTLLDNREYHINCGESEEINYVFITKYRKLSPGEMGCTCSHRKIYLDLIKSDKDYAIVFEDDILIKNKDFTPFLYSLINDMSENMIIYLDAWGPDMKDVTRQKTFGDRLIPLTKGPEIYGLYSIIFDKKFAKNMLDKGNHETAPIDVSIGEYIRDHRVRAYITNKVMVGITTKFKSEINQMGRPH